MRVWIKKSEPVFDYIVYADVTDINGETHSGQNTISAGYKSLNADVNIKDLDIGQNESITQKYSINTTNLAGYFEAAEGTIKIWKLKGPEKAFRDRMWDRPDKTVMTKEDFYKDFPHDQYAEENNYYKWDIDKEVYDQNFNSANGREFEIKNLKNWDTGKYKLEIACKDKYGEDVKNIEYFEVYSLNDRKLSFPTVNQFKVLKDNCEPGEKALILAGSSEKTNVLLEIEQDGKILEKRRMMFNDEKQSIEIPILEEYRGNIALHYTFIKDNRLYSETSTINVPYTNKELDIRFETFRDKLQPGEKEQWKLKITGKKADKVMAEMVATLYDASLDVFRSNNWSANFFNSIDTRLQWNSINGFEAMTFRNYEKDWNRYNTKNYSSSSYDELNWFGYDRNIFYPYRSVLMEDAIAVGYGTMTKTAAPMAAEMNIRGVNAEMKKKSAVAIPEELNQEQNTSQTQIKSKEVNVDMSNIKIRKNFDETAFFYPDLQTDENGEIIIKFTVPEALTRWKMLGFAHTKDLKSGTIVNELVTQKDLMIVSNQPRFFRENDNMYFSAKITSLADKDLSGEAQLEFFDALTMKPIDGIMKNHDNQKHFNVKSRQSTNLEWHIEIPEGVQAISYHIVAKAGKYSDGEEMILPVVTNRMLVTETLPLPIRGKETKTFKFEKLLNDTSSTLKNQRFTLEFTSNPAWYAIQALPYMMEYPYECTEQTFSRFYANSIASHIANRIRKSNRCLIHGQLFNLMPCFLTLKKIRNLKRPCLKRRHGC